MRQERRPYLMRARQTEVIPCRKLSGGGILELIKKIRQACPTIKKQKLKTNAFLRPQNPQKEIQTLYKRGPFST